MEGNNRLDGDNSRAYTPSYNIDLTECESRGVSLINNATTITTYAFLCGSEVIEQAQTAIEYFKDLRTCNHWTKNEISYVLFSKM